MFYIKLFYDVFLSTRSVNLREATRFVATSSSRSREGGIADGVTDAGSSRESSAIWEPKVVLGEAQGVVSAVVVESYGWVSKELRRISSCWGSDANVSLFQSRVKSG